MKKFLFSPRANSSRQSHENERRSSKAGALAKSNFPEGISRPSGRGSLLFVLISFLILVQGASVFAIASKDSKEEGSRDNVSNNEESSKENDSEEKSYDQLSPIKDRTFNYQNKVNLYKSSREDFLEAKEKFKDNKIKNKELLQEEAGSFLENSINALINHLEAIKKKTENAPRISEATKSEILSEIEEDIEWLESKKGEIEESSIEEKREIAKEIREYWKQTRARIRQIVGHMMANRINNVILKAKETAEEISKVLEKLEEAGEDVSDIKNSLDSFYKNIDLAQEKYKEAKEIFDSIPDENNFGVLFKDGRSAINEAHQYLKDALKDLRKIVKELKEYKDREITLFGTGMLIAEGDGRVSISGNGEFEVSGKKGKLIIEDNGGDAKIEVGGFGSKNELAENKWQYQGAGTASVGGSDILVELKGKDLEVAAIGTGTVVLEGKGNYQKCKENFCPEKNWQETGVNVEITK